MEKYGKMEGCSCGCSCARELLNFQNTFQRIVAVERKKLSSRSRSRGDEYILSIPYMAKQYASHLKVLSIFRPTNDVRPEMQVDENGQNVFRPNYLSVLEAIQFMHMLLDQDLSAVNTMIKDGIIDCVIGASHVYIVTFRPHPQTDDTTKINSLLTAVIATKDTAIWRDETSKAAKLAISVQGPQGPNDLPYANLVVQLTVFLAVMSEAISTARSRFLLSPESCYILELAEPHLCHSVFDIFYSQSFKSAVDVHAGLANVSEKVMNMSTTPKTPPSAQVFIVAKYLIWTLKNLTNSTDVDYSYIADQYPIPMILHLILLPAKYYGNGTGCLAPTLLTTVTEGLGLISNLLQLDALTTSRILDRSTVRELCLRALCKIWVDFPTNVVILKQTCVILNHLTSARSPIMADMIRLIIELNMVKDIIRFINLKSIELEPASALSLTLFAVMVVGNLAAHTRSETSTALISAGVVPALFSLLQREESFSLHANSVDYANVFSKHSKICKEALWALSNLCAGTPLQTCQVVSWQNFKGFEQLVKYTVMPNNCSTPHMLSARQEAAWTLINTCQDNPKFESLIAKYQVIDRLIDYCYLQMAVGGAKLEPQVLRILDMVEANPPSDRTKMSDLCIFLSIFGTSADTSANLQHRLSDLIVKYSDNQATNIEELD